MVMPNEEREREEIELSVPQPIGVPEPEEESEVPEAELTDEDMDDLFGVDPQGYSREEGDLDDLLEVSDEDLFGVGEPKPTRPQRYKRTPQRYVPPNDGMGGMRY